MMRATSDRTTHTREQKKRIETGEAKELRRQAKLRAQSTVETYKRPGALVQSESSFSLSETKAPLCWISQSIIITGAIEERKRRT